MLTYAVGDIHGRRDLLAELLTEIDRHAGGRERRIVFLGDYIDRGPDSAGVVATVRKLQSSEQPDRIVALKGNHEDLCVRAAAEPDREDLWLVNGGVATLASYGSDSIRDMPADALAWMAARPTCWEDECRCFVHAGLSPLRPRDRQSDHDRLWVRDPFLDVDHDFGKFVVHGHTPRVGGVPDLRPFRVNLDTAAVFGGRLTAGVFEDGRGTPTEFLSVGPVATG